LREGEGGSALVGIRNQAQGEPDPGWQARDDVLDGLTTVASANLAYDAVVRPEQLPACVRAARTVPGLRFVLDHLGKPDIAAGGFQYWRDQLAPLADCPNVMVKLSGMVTEADWTTWTSADLRPYVQTVVNLFGVDRVMFGSDWPVCTLAATYQQVVAALLDCLGVLSAAEHQHVFADNAVRTYRLA